MWANNAYVEELGLMATSNAFTNTHFGLDSANTNLPINSGTVDTSASMFGLTQTDFLLYSNQPALVTVAVHYQRRSQCQPE